ncbi:hypothetical protein C3E99_13345 [Sphingopyxis sp. MG]|nr:hypothetical protein C3E99_13345 [Sphingopyxis sp. MG]
MQRERAMGLENNKHLKIIDPAANDDFIARRLEAISKLAQKIRRITSLPDQARFASQLVDALAHCRISDDSKAWVTEALVKAAPSFEDDGNKDNELGILLVLACGDAIDVAATAASAPSMEFLAQAALSGLQYVSSLNDPQRELLRKDLMGLARSKIQDRGAQARQRQPVPTPVTSENCAAAATIMASNAKWDREEIDLLWWVVTDWSVVGDVRVSTLDAEPACVVSAIETSGLFAGPASQAHRNIATRHVGRLAEEQTPKEFASGSVEARTWARHALQNGIEDISRYPAILPALSIATLTDDQVWEALPASITAGAPLTIADWCRRLVDEIELLSRLGRSIVLTPAR